MEQAKIRKLLNKYYEAKTTLEEEAILREYFNSDRVAESLKEEATPFLFYEEQGRVEPFAPQEWPAFPETNGGPGSVWRSRTYRMMQAAAVLLVAAAGFGSGIWFAGHQQTNQETSTAMTALISAELPASRRIQTVQEMAASQGSDQIIAALVEAMNGDPNVNVRLAAAEALYRFRDERPVRKALAESLNNQSDPNMQITLIDILVRIRSREGVRVMKQLLLADGLQPVVRTRLEAGIADLI